MVPFSSSEQPARKLYVSAENTSVRMFRNDVLDYLSRVRPWVPLALYGPLAVLCLTLHFYRSRHWWPGCGLVALGLAAWTLFEYSLHRWVFHYSSHSAWSQRLHFIIHGVHHDYPNDALRLVMPPVVSVPLAILIYGLSRLVWGAVPGLAFYAGFVMGYLVYDNLHYAVHHFNFRNRWFQRLKRHHMWHHYRDPSRGFGFTSGFWDWVFGTDFSKPRR
ncbi:MAG: sterol desaturase family protein [Flavobacteriales bacterium]|nr:sterol desaturase family protein [Flavobacteriales bacterium]MDW8409742.1 sterol desaturase family protein [Flavobacteriales bacterium]